MLLILYSSSGMESSLVEQVLSTILVLPSIFESSPFTFSIRRSYLSFLERTILYLLLGHLVLAASLLLRSKIYTTNSLIC